MPTYLLLHIESALVFLRPPGVTRKEGCLSYLEFQEVLGTFGYISSVTDRPGYPAYMGAESQGYPME